MYQYVEREISTCYPEKCGVLRLVSQGAVTIQSYTGAESENLYSRQAGCSGFVYGYVGGYLLFLASDNRK